MLHPDLRGRYHGRDHQRFAPGSDVDGDCVTRVLKVFDNIKDRFRGVIELFIVDYFTFYLGLEPELVIKNFDRVQCMVELVMVRFNCEHIHDIRIIAFISQHGIIGIHQRPDRAP